MATETALDLAETLREVDEAVAELRAVRDRLATVLYQAEMQGYGAMRAENERLRQIIARHDAERELGRCDGLLDPGAGKDVI